MYIVIIAWMYVALMMAVAEASHSQGTILGAIVTFLLYGLVPMALVVYIMRTPARREARLKAESEAQPSAATGSNGVTATESAPSDASKPADQ